MGKKHSLRPYSAVLCFDSVGTNLLKYTRLGHHFQGQKVKDQLARGGDILWQPLAQLVTEQNVRVRKHSPLVIKVMPLASERVPGSCSVMSTRGRARVI